MKILIYPIVRKLRYIASVMLLVFSLSGALANASEGRSTQALLLLDKTFEVFLYRPSACPSSLRGHLLVFHGVERNAADYRDRAITIADRYCLNIYAPLFTKAEFPKAKYQEGGWSEGNINKKEFSPTTKYGIELIRWIEKNASQANTKIYLIGHSAGSQYLSRLAAFETLPNSVQRVVIANPSTWVWPSTDLAAPYGFKGLSNPNKTWVEYLRKPITVYLGGADTGTHNLAVTPEAMAQGENRLARGEGVYAAAQIAAEQNGVSLQWRRVKAAGVGHDSEKMFAADELGVALGLVRVDKPTKK